MKTPSIILLEFNELSPALMQRFMNEGHLPNFRKLYSMSDVYLTEASEAQEDLEPWIQWVTIHTGLSHAEHQVSRLGQGLPLKAPRLWTRVTEAGRNSLIFGSMNQGNSADVQGVVLPDPWSTDVVPKPNELRVFFDFIQDQVQNHTLARPLGLNKPTLHFLWFMITHGLSVSTLWAILKQLVGEKIVPSSRYKRVALLDKLQFDLFQRYYRAIQPMFSSFFLNSTAHLQHLYWRNLFPDAFEIKPTAEEQAAYGDAILFGYRSMDALVGQFLRLDPDATLVFATAISQQACTRYESIGGKTFNRPRSFKALLDFAGLPAPYTYAPVMAEEFYVYLPNEQAARQAYDQLLRLQVDGRTVFQCELRGSSVFCGCKIFDAIPEDAMLTMDGSPEKQTPFYRLFYVVKDKKSGMHHPQGMLWIQRSDHQAQIHSENLPLTAVYRMLLAKMGLESPHTEETASPVACISPS
jgi:hypothetical protein